MLATHTLAIWRTQVRFIGAGAIGVAAIYTLARLARPVVGGLMSTLAASRVRTTGDETDRDLSPQWILALTVVCLVIAAWLAYDFARLEALMLRLDLTTVQLVWRESATVFHVRDPYPVRSPGERTVS